MDKIIAVNQISDGSNIYKVRNCGFQNQTPYIELEPVNQDLAERIIKKMRRDNMLRLQHRCGKSPLFEDD